MQQLRKLCFTNTMEKTLIDVLKPLVDNLSLTVRQL